MKGVVFTEFIEMVEDRFSPEMADRIIERAKLPSGGAYTTVGTYDHGEMIQLVLLSQRGNGHSLRRARALVRHAPLRPLSYDVPEVLRGCLFLVRLSPTDRSLYPCRGAEAVPRCGTAVVRLRHLPTRMPASHVPILPPVRRPRRGIDPRLCRSLWRGGRYRVEDLSDGAGTAARFLLTKRGAAP
jgi:Haem-NO-binding